jgi:hypothetical protein
VRLDVACVLFLFSPCGAGGDSASGSATGAGRPGASSTDHKTALPFEVFARVSLTPPEKAIVRAMTIRRVVRSIL